ncbi:GTP--adenosylcobinamide-phosphate guanylyltransferase [Methanoregula formicica]|uniref:GTP:adenosylcobinamide-phosphate guanylyltransferase n=1 Tax=Methanoregula formicica (strain DSM 22288 / NBRC 105244 / SMSP) TaxID=593750 RepID=L0HG78_METFS|nr:GTP--adenosylcobinamide-phosphate guanylyltransferase [Methanoregula formicica]AGB02786.1 GTP:adenosylcobinamide-phosphate guanylyltransferase [Methanoregula formicica SMSP]
MRALIMAGGSGSRLNSGEKPLALICGQPMIAYVIRAFQNAGCEPVVAGSSKTPMTANWCRANGIAFCRTDGRGYVDDMVQAVCSLDEDGALFVSVADIPCITAEIIKTIEDAYMANGKDALSTWVPAATITSCRESMPYREKIGGIEACPAGINIIRGDHAGDEQDEFRLLLSEPRLSLNINTQGDRERAEAFLWQNPPP